MSQTLRDPSVDVLRRMLDDAQALAQLGGDPVLAPRCSFLVRYISDMLALKDPNGPLTVGRELGRRPG
ncbi:MAG: hypothetical protein AB1679_00650 [Actinomycetota bacterium]